VALALARALRCSVEDLFELHDDAEPIAAEWVCFEGEPHAPRRSRRGFLPRRVALGQVGERWVAHPLSLDSTASMCTPADGLLALRHGRESDRAPSSSAVVRVRPLRSRSELRANILAAGCDPAMGLLSAWLGERHAPARLTWLYAPSVAALQALAQGKVHIAGAHLLDEASNDYNVPFVRSLRAPHSFAIINLARWEEGFVVAPQNPLGIRTVHDLLRKRITFVNREQGSEARKLIDRLLRRERITAQQVRGFDRIARGHGAVAHAVAAGAADVGIASRTAAAALGLDFQPLSSERFDLVASYESLGEERIGRLTDALRTPSFRRELASIAGYATDQCGKIIAEIQPS
jgi:putative molybdopterin biosynthesis protein